MNEHQWSPADRCLGLARCEPNRITAPMQPIGGPPQQALSRQAVLRICMALDDDALAWVYQSLFAERSSVMERVTQQVVQALDKTENARLQELDSSLNGQKTDGFVMADDTQKQSEALPADDADTESKEPTGFTVQSGLPYGNAPTDANSWSVGQTRVRSITCMRCSLQETGRGMGSLHRESLHEYSSGHRCVMQVKKTPQWRWPLYALGIVVSDPLLIGQREIFQQRQERNTQLLLASLSLRAVRG